MIVVVEVLGCFVQSVGDDFDASEDFVVVFLWLFLSVISLWFIVCLRCVFVLVVAGFIVCFGVFELYLSLVSFMFSQPVSLLESFDALA